MMIKPIILTWGKITAAAAVSTSYPFFGLVIGRRCPSPIKLKLIDLFVGLLS